MKRNLVWALFVMLFLSQTGAFAQTESEAGPDRLFWKGAALFSSSQIKDPTWEKAKEYLRAVLRESPDDKKSSALLKIMEQMEKQDQKKEQDESDQKESESSQGQKKSGQEQKESRSDRSKEQESKQDTSSVSKANPDTSQTLPDRGPDTSMTASQMEAQRLLDLFMENQKAVPRNLHKQKTEGRRIEKDW